MAFITQETNQSMKGSQVFAKDLLMNITGGSIGRTALIIDDFAGGNVNQHVLIIRLINSSFRHFIHRVLHSDFILGLMFSKQTGDKPGLSAEKVNRFLIPIPPLAEQQRIVKQIETLLGYVDIIDTDAETLEKSITLAKQKILDLAIRGKLVPQAPADEPASELLKKIKAEKDALVKAGKLKKDKHESFIFKSDDNCYHENIDGKVTDITEEIPFDLPEGWCFSRIGQCINLVNGRAYRQNELLSQGRYKVLRVGNFFTNSSWYYSDLDLEPEKYCYTGDLLYAWSASFGPKIWQGEKTIFHYHIWNVKFPETLFDKNFLFYFFLYDKEKLHGSTTGSTMVHISMEHMTPRFVPLPPLAEQKRIVSQVEKLFSVLETMRG